MRYQLGLVNLAAAALMEIPIDEDMFATNAPWLSHASDPAAGWVERGFAAPFVRILGVSDATPEEAAAAEAAAAAAANM